MTVNVVQHQLFQNEILATGFDLPTAIKFLPDGRLLVAELAGTIKVLPPPYTQPDPTPFLQLTNIGSAGVQQGIYDIALDPNFATNHYYYVFYTLERRTATAFALHRQRALTGTIAGQRARPLSGSAGRQRRASRRRDQFRQRRQDLLHHRRALRRRRRAVLTSPRGKIHRINPDGTVPTDNPFYDGDRAQLGLDLGLRAAQSVPGLLRRADRSAVHRRRRRQRLFDRHGRSEYRRRGRQLRLAERRRDLQQPGLHESALLLPPQRPRRLDHRRLRLPRHASSRAAIRAATSLPTTRRTGSAA